MSTRDLAKKIIIISSIVLVVIIVIIHFIYPMNGTLVCKGTGIAGDIKVKYTYSVKFKLRKIENISIKRVSTSSNEDALKSYAEALDDDKKTYDKLNNYEMDLKEEKEKITYKLNIDYKKSKKRMSLKELKSNYERQGAICKYK